MAGFLEESKCTSSPSPALSKMVVIFTILEINNPN